MSIPISNKVEVRVDMKDGYYMDRILIQLKDGSVYMADVNDAMTLEPVSRSFAGGVIKNNMKNALSEISELQRLEKHLVNNKRWFDAESCYADICELSEQAEELKKFWKEFKKHSSKKKKHKEDVETAKLRIDSSKKLKKCNCHTVSYTCNVPTGAVFSWINTG